MSTVSSFDCPSCLDEGWKMYAIVEFVGRKIRVGLYGRDWPCRVRARANRLRACRRILIRMLCGRNGFFNTLLSSWIADCFGYRSPWLIPARHFRHEQNRRFRDSSRRHTAENNANSAVKCLMMKQSPSAEGSSTSGQNPNQQTPAESPATGNHEPAKRRKLITQPPPEDRGARQTNCIRVTRFACRVARLGNGWCVPRRARGAGKQSWRRVSMTTGAGSGWLLSAQPACE